MTYKFIECSDIHQLEAQVNAQTIANEYVLLGAVQILAIDHPAYQTSPGAYMNMPWTEYRYIATLIKTSNA